MSIEMPRSFLIKKKSDREHAAERSQHAEACCDDNDEMTADQPWPSAPPRKQEPEVRDDATSLVAVSRRTAIWSPAAELHVDSGKKSTAPANESPTSGLTPFTPLSAAAAFLHHPQGNYSPVCTGFSARRSASAGELTVCLSVCHTPASKPLRG